MDYLILFGFLLIALFCAFVITKFIMFLLGRKAVEPSKNTDRVLIVEKETEKTIIRTEQEMWQEAEAKLRKEEEERQKREEEENKTIVKEVAAVVAEPVVEVVPIMEEPREKPGFCTLSRADVMDHFLDMQKDSARFPFKPFISERQKKSLPDLFMCGDVCFGMMFERGEIVFNVILRMSEKNAEALEKNYSIQKTTFMSDENWYNLAIDRSFSTKNEIYAIIDESCDFVQSETMTAGQKEQEDARLQQLELEKQIMERLNVLEQATVAAEAEYLEKLERYKAENYTKFLITRKEIVDDILAMGNPNITATLRPKQPQFPASLKYKGKTYAMLHGTDTGVVMIIRISASYADSLSSRHPEICRASFPKGSNWYHVPVDGAFSNKESVFRVLEAACEYVKAKAVEAEIDAKVAERIATQKTKSERSTKSTSSASKSSGTKITTTSKTDKAATPKSKTKTTVTKTTVTGTTSEVDSKSK